MGDEFVQDFNGRVLNTQMPSLKNVYKYWNATFTLDGGASVDGVALGISGDSVCIVYNRVLSFPYCTFDSIFLCMLLDFQPLLENSAWRTAGIQSVLDSHWNQ